MAEEARAAEAGLAATLSVVVVAAHTTTHLPPARAVITTPALVALIEQCIVRAEGAAGADGWSSVAADIKHRAGLRRGEVAHVAVERTGASADTAEWVVRVTADDRTAVAEGTIARRREWQAE